MMVELWILYTGKKKETNQLAFHDFEFLQCYMWYHGKSFQSQKQMILLNIKSPSNWVVIHKGTESGDFKFYYGKVRKYNAWRRYLGRMIG
jgi:hypothetical protein